MNQESQKLIPQTQLSCVFPDIEGQLCSRHSSLFGKLKTTFNKLYDSFNPSHYVVVKGIATVLETDQVSLSMALENGMILLVRQTYENSKVYFNGNHIDEEIIFQPNGKLEEGLHESSEEMQIVFKEVIEDLPLNKLHGGIIYLHSNIPQGFFQYKKIMMMSLFLGIMIINQNISSYSVDELIQKMVKTKVMGDEPFIQSQFKNYQNNQFHLRVGENSHQIPCQSDLKLVLCRLDLAKQDICHQKERKAALISQRNKIIQWMEAQCGVSSFYQAFEEQIQIPENQFPDCIEKQQLLELINEEMKELSMMCQFSNKNVNFKELISHKWKNNLQIWKIYPQEITQLVADIMKNSKLDCCLLVENQFLLIPVLKKQYAELIYELRGLCHRGELKSKSLFKIEEEIIENRWNSDKQIGEKIFASIPSKGLAIFDPTDSMWFD